jgi:hypothetical protein
LTKALKACVDIMQDRQFCRARADEEIPEFRCGSAGELLALRSVAEGKGVLLISEVGRPLRGRC